MQMDLDLALDIFWIETWHFLALAVSLTVNGILIRRAEKSPLRNRYIAVQSCLLLWIASKILKTISPDADWRWAFIVLQYLGVSFLGFAFFRFAYLFVRRKDPPGVINAVLAIGSVCCFLLVASNPHHYRFYASYTFYRDTFGSLFYLTMGFSVCAGSGRADTPCLQDRGQQRFLCTAQVDRPGRTDPADRECPVYHTNDPSDV